MSSTEICEAEIDGVPTFGDRAAVGNAVGRVCTRELEAQEAAEEEEAEKEKLTRRNADLEEEYAAIDEEIDRLEAQHDARLRELRAERDQLRTELDAATKFSIGRQRELHDALYEANDALASADLAHDAIDLGSIPVGIIGGPVTAIALFGGGIVNDQLRPGDFDAIGLDGANALSGGADAIASLPSLEGAVRPASRSRATRPELSVASPRRRPRTEDAS